MLAYRQAVKPAENMKISVGHDSRVSADKISNVVVNALRNSGVHAVNCKLSSTPAMFMTTVKLDCDAAIQITASHHPSDKNGFKFFLNTGGLEGSDITEILALADVESTYIASEKGKLSNVDFMSVYAADLRKLICDSLNKKEEDAPLSGYKIVVDAGNGVGGFYANDVLLRLGADISGSQFLNPDGTFPNHIPNPENEAAMLSACNAVKAVKADLGIVFDTDVDRAGCVDSLGEEINRNRLIALASYIVADKPGAVIVTDSITSDGVTDFIEDVLSCKHFRFRRGYKNVIEKAKELCDKGENCPLAIETSGHAALRENYFLDDGAYLVTKIVIELAKGKSLEAMLSSLKLPAEESEYRFKILNEDFKGYGEMVLNEFEKYARSRADWKVCEENFEGIRVNAFDGWFLLRISVHDPVMPINMESNSVGGIAKMKNALTPFFKSFPDLDISNFN